MKKRIVTVTMAAILILGAAGAAVYASTRVLKLTPGGGAALISSPKEHLGKVHRIKTRGPKKPAGPTIKDLRKPKPIRQLNKIKKPKKIEHVKRVL